MSHAVQGYPRLIGRGGEFWQNMVHWRVNGKPFQYTSEEYWEEPYEQYEQAKDMTLKDELPMLVGAQYATGDQWRNNSRKNGEVEPSKNNTQLWMWLVMEVKSNAIKNNSA